jgi:ligand-binding SRPBCC domain-containing protein
MALRSNEELNVFQKPMPKIELSTEIDSTIEICFDLARSIDFHVVSTASTNERAVAGRTSGLIELNETVTWQATHFGVRQKLTSKITAFNRPYYFVDEQISGVFKSIYHEHRFEEINSKVLMTDVFEFQSPFGILGTLFNELILTNYMKRLLANRNSVIKEYAETNRWKSVLPKR